MKESNEGILRLEMLTELGMRDVLEFIYTGSVQISDTANNAQELIVMADYLDLPHLKTLAETILLNYLNASNAISTILLKNIDARNSFPYLKVSSLQVSTPYRKWKSF